MAKWQRSMVRPRVQQVLPVNRLPFQTFVGNLLATSVG